MIPEYSEVRIVRISGNSADRVISSSYAPPFVPQVGETATVVDARVDGRIIVEFGEPDGCARWVAWFREDEVEPA